MFNWPHENPCQSLEDHKENSKDKGSESGTIVELCQKLSDITGQSTRFTYPLYKKITIEEEKLKLLLIGQHKGIAESPKEEYRQTEKDC